MSDDQKYTFVKRLPIYDPFFAPFGSWKAKHAYQKTSGPRKPFSPGHHHGTLRLSTVSEL